VSPLRLIKPPRPVAVALTVAVAYAGVSLAWILLSDEFIATLASDRRELVLLSKIKGVVFVLLMTLLIGILVYYMAERRAALANALLSIRRDAVTGLPNRRVLEETLQERCRNSRDAGTGFGIILLDVVDVSRVNTALGRSAGDRFLRAVAERLLALAGSGDLVTRLEGDVFAIVIREAPAAGMVRGLAGAVMSVLEEPVVIDGVSLTVDAHLGLARTPEDGVTPAQLLDAAMQALHAAKRRGHRNRLTLVDAAAGDGRGPLEHEGALREALRCGAIEAYLQPVVSLTSGQVIGAEALARWPRPDGSIIPPGEFIPVAEAAGLIGDITEQMLDRVIQQGARWRHAGLAPLSLAVNLSGLDLQSEQLLPTVRRLLAEHRMPGRALMLEITESRFMRDPQGARGLLEALRALGIAIAIDDFGTGYSSLSYLHRLPLDCLKIDRSFVRGADRDPDRRTLLDAIGSLGRALRLTTVAEGVETRAEAALAHELGCDALQGYLVAPPMPPGEFADRYLERTATIVPEIAGLADPGRHAAGH